MRIGLFCTYENPAADQRAAYAAQTRLVEHAEALGFDEAWIAEHHFNPDALSPSCLPIMAFLAAKTRRMRLGSAAVLLPCHSPLKVAEDLATLDLLSDGRLDFGVGKGGPFPMQNKHFGLAPEEARGKLAEGLDLVTRLLYEGNVSFNGRYYQADGINLQPSRCKGRSRPILRPRRAKPCCRRLIMAMASWPGRPSRWHRSLTASPPIARWPVRRKTRILFSSASIMSA